MEPQQNNDKSTPISSSESYSKSKSQISSQQLTSNKLSATEQKLSPSLNLSSCNNGTSGIDTRYNVVRRNGKITHFNSNKINVAITKAFLAVEGGQAASSQRVHEMVDQLVQQVIEALTRRDPHGGTLHIEDIQDQVELALMRSGQHKVARAYVLYREQHAKQREQKREQLLTQQREQNSPHHAESSLLVTLENGDQVPVVSLELERTVMLACDALSDVDANIILSTAYQQFYDGITLSEIHQALLLAARSYIEHEPNYSYVAARLLINALSVQANNLVGVPLSCPASDKERVEYCGKDYFKQFITFGVSQSLLDPILLQYDLDLLATKLQPLRDLQFTYLGAQTLYDRYLLHVDNIRFEMPQAFFMRVAMGLSINETDRESKTIEFYNVLSSFDFMCSTPTLFNSAMLRPQLSSCYLTTVQDDLKNIYDAIRDNALLSKYAGGLGNDWTAVRAMGAHINGTNGKSQGVVPFLKVVNDTAVAVNQGGKRKGAVCAYLETWHLDIEEFIELRKNTGDERRRTHDMNTANWIPDLFMRRVINDEPWTLFSPDDCPDLHELYGEEFERAYLSYEQKANTGDIKHSKTISAKALWRKMLTMLYETGHPWITFKDACNVRSPQQHAGVVHSSNLCTEITLNTSENEIAVCNLGSVNLAAHIKQGALDLEKLSNTINTAMRMLDNVIDINFYSVPQARTSNLRHRPVGLGIMGFQDVLHKLHITYDSEQALDFADFSMQAVSYFAINASCELAMQRGAYSSFKDSLWSQGILPIDSISLLRAARNGDLEMNELTSDKFDWQGLRNKIQQFGMRNSNCLAIAPTATIANICGVSQSIEPTYQNLYVKSNLSGEFTVVNPYLVESLKREKLWDSVMINDLKYFDGSVQKINRCPQHIKILFKCAFEVDPAWLVHAASRRQKWIDQSQSLNLYLNEPSGKKLDSLYQLAWRCGLKTTYYLRSLAATRNERATVESNTLNSVARVSSGHSLSSQPMLPNTLSCNLDNMECEACQ